MADIAKLPTNATLDIKPFKAHVPEERLQHFKNILLLSPIGPPTFENSSNGQIYGIERNWLEHAKNVWLNEFNWRSFEDRLNSYPSFTSTVQDTNGNNITVHFLALFSEKPNAVPICFLHGWPGSICEFIDILDILKSRHSPKDLPYHVIVPSLPGYGYSSGPPLHTEFGVDDAAKVVNDLMVGLGFGGGYLTQGGDLGSFVSRELAAKYDSCKGMHINQMMPPAGVTPEDLPKDKMGTRAMQRAMEMMDTGYGFAIEQATRPATIGFVLSSSPLGLLSWVGEKILAWTDETPPLEKILETVTLYWMTDTISRSFYHNRQFLHSGEGPRMGRIREMSQMKFLQLPFIEKPCGYTLFANEIVPVPRSWAELSCNIVSFHEHERGGHFAGMERPGELLRDVEDFIKTAWPMITKANS